jgi:peptide/nickel transport system permease protein
MLPLLRHARYVLSENPVTGLAFGLFAMFLLAAILGPVLAPYSPLQSNAAMTLKPPSAEHWFGTDQLGRDIFSRVLVATRLDLTIAFASVVLAFALGALSGVAAGYFGGWTDRVVGRLADTIMAFPLFVLAVGIAAAMGNSLSSVILATAIVNLPFYVRQTRTEVNRRRNAAYVEAARLAGFSPIAIVGLHIMPNLAAPLAVQSSLNMGWAILNAAGLSFIGLGIRPPTPEWGILVSDGATYIFSGEWWLFVCPGAVLMMAVLAFGLVGDALRDRLDPRRP